MKQINELDYLYISGLVRALEGALLNRDRMISMIDARTVEDAFEILTECGYPLPETFSTGDLEMLLEKERHNTFDRFTANLPDPVIVDVFRVRYDYQNVKVLLKKGHTRDAPFQLTQSGRIKPEKLQTFMLEKNDRDLPKKLRIAIDTAQEILDRTGDPQLSDMTLDQACLEEMLSLAEMTGSLFLKDYIRRLVDTTNLKTLLRVKRMGKGRSFLTLALIPGGFILITPLIEESDDIKLEALFSATWLREIAATGFQALRTNTPLTVVDRDCDNILLSSLHPAKMLAYGAPLAIAYFAAKEAEITALRTILTGHLVGMGPEQIMERIRTTYV